jgi:protein import protein ZIM17
VLITCFECKNRHVISDHLKIFADKSFTLEQLLQEKGELVKRGSLEGDVEFWDDGTKVERGEMEQRVLRLSSGRDG